MHKSRLLSDNGSSYIPGDLAEWLEEYKWIKYGALHTIHRSWARSNVGIKRLKNQILLENYYLPRDLEKQIG